MPRTTAVVPQAGETPGMPTPQDLSGHYLAFQIDQGGAVPKAQAAQIVGHVMAGQTTASVVSTWADGPGWTRAAPQVRAIGLQMGGHRAPAPAAPAAFHNRNQPWTFTWLRYMAGAVTVCPLGQGAMTGPMSGCYLFLYTQNGQRHLAHVGTSNTPTEGKTIRAKASWNAFTAQPGVTDVVGGSPRDFVSDLEFQQGFLGPMQMARPPQIVGYFGADGSAWTMLLSPVPQAMNPPVPLLKVSLVKRMTLQPWSGIKAMRRFRD